MKRLITTIVTLIILLSIITPAYAADTSSVVSLSQDCSSVTRTEQTVWYFRTINGYLEKRLWSLTYGKWLTDWIVVG